MSEAARAIQTLVVTEAVRDATIGGRKVKRGQTIALGPDDGLLAAGNDREAAVLEGVAAFDAGFELITLFYGDGADLAEAEAMARRIGAASSGVEVEVSPFETKPMKRSRGEKDSAISAAWGPYNVMTGINDSEIATKIHSGDPVSSSAK